MALETLPPELLSLILQAVDSSTTFHHLISASPSCLRAFSQSPSLILSAVLKNALPGGNLRHALAVLQVPSTYDKIPAFLEKYFDPSSTFDFPTNRASLLQLSGLCNCLSYLLDQFVEESLSDLHRHDASENRGNLDEKQDLPSAVELPPPLSASERVRLQRAFLRFELYCRVFPGHRGDPNGPTGRAAPTHRAAEQARLFLSRLIPWEVEEMCCIEQHFYTLIRRIIRDLDNALVTAVRTAPGVVLPSSAKEPPLREHVGQVDLVPFENLDETDLTFFSQWERLFFPDYDNYMSSLGLDFMYKLVMSAGRQRLALVTLNSRESREEGFLREALDARARGVDWPHPPKDPAATDDDDTFSRNLGYRLFGKKRGDNNYMLIFRARIDRLTIRHLGYVFWDAARIRSPAVYEKLVAAKRAPTDDFHLVFRRRKSVEARLEGVKLPRDQMKRIEKEFGSPVLGE
ncbi:hypothetical protein NM208_g2306 [Fusarium decemcellulare]|uniref:Uncharacterized protein n=1 Tax=Fusarium decemcellulare TaxID=57161 RepID=A0ACC1ST99_9HYPO|nr:hypothetical protein NM208_g2306 [Fusarium decemcellulare]